jgi:hypothetical protein
MSRWVIFFVPAMALIARTAEGALQATVTMPHPGVTHSVYTDAAVPLRLHLITLDVSSQELHFYATQAAERGQTVSDFAACKKGVAGCVPSDVAINGGLFAPLGFVPGGLAIGGAKAWSDASMDNAQHGFLAFGRPSDVNQVLLSAPMTVEQPPASLAAEGALSGRTLLVQNGQAQAPFNAMDPTQPYRLAPRTAVGLDGTKRTLYLVVVDGDQASSKGMTSEDLASFLISVGAAEALELDGGGASALYVKKEGGLVSSPSDGVQRPVANHLGVSYGPLPYRASVVGKVFDSKFGDDTKVITNATVTVDGKTATWNTTAPAHTIYNVDDIAPHLVCARASAPGFKSAQQCRQITAADIQASQIQYLSLVVYPGTDPPPDMSTPPDLAAPRDAGVPADLAVPRDQAGLDEGSTSGGCAIAGHARTGALGFVLLAVVCVALTRRRRPNAQMTPND